jgi:hypothetical protein
MAQGYAILIQLVLFCFFFTFYDSTSDCTTVTLDIIYPPHMVLGKQRIPLAVLILYSVATGLATTRSYGLIDALSPVIRVGFRLGCGVI